LKFLLPFLFGGFFICERLLFQSLDMGSYGLVLCFLCWSLGY
jgi:hypothetical protein